MRRLLASLDTADRLTFGGVGLQAAGFALLPLSFSAVGLIVPGLWLTVLGLLLARKGEEE